MSTLRHVLSLESVINGKLQRELEYTLYAKLKDMSQLERAFEKEEHEQWSLPLDTDKPVKLRLRLINGRRYTMAAKLKTPGVLGCDEVEDDISPDTFKVLRIGATAGYKKTRYNFKIPNSELKWEIDVFLDQNGSPHPWVKIDLEVNTPDDEVPDLPVDIESLIVDNGPKQTMEEIRFVRNLWDREWSRLDPVNYGKKDTDD